MDPYDKESPVLKCEQLGAEMPVPSRTMCCHASLNLAFTVASDAAPGFLESNFLSAVL